MNIAYASDDKFVDVMCVSIMSFNDYNSNANIYILDCGITESNKERIQRICGAKNSISFIDARRILDNMGEGLNFDRGSDASYARLFLGSMLPETVEKVIYLDSDTLIRDSLETLFLTDIDSYVVAGIRDSFSSMNKKVFGIKKGDLFINCGVMLIDIKKWRDEKIEDKIYKLLEKNKKVFQGDQGIINSVFRGDVYELPLKYDVMSYLFDFTYEEMILYRKPDYYHSKSEVERATENPIIVHFSSSFVSNRPWTSVDGNNHPFFSQWSEYYDLVEGKIGKGKRRMKKSILLLFFAGILHAYARPATYYLLGAVT